MQIQLQQEKIQTEEQQQNSTLITDEPLLLRDDGTLLRIISSRHEILNSWMEYPLTS